MGEFKVNSPRLGERKAVAKEDHDGREIQFSESAPIRAEPSRHLMWPTTFSITDTFKCSSSSS